MLEFSNNDDGDEYYVLKLLFDEAATSSRLAYGKWQLTTRILGDPITEIEAYMNLKGDKIRRTLSNPDNRGIWKDQTYLFTTGPR